MKEIILTNGEIALVSDEDYERVVEMRWMKESIGYVKSTKWQSVRLHRFIMNAKYGDIVDHKNCNKLDNRRENLRFATKAQNAINKNIKSNNTSNYKGVALMHKKYIRAYITVNRKQIHLGIFKTKEDAAIAYDNAAKIYYGEFANLNFPKA